MTASAIRLLTPSIPLTARNDAELVAACLAREPAAERALYDGHYDALFRVAFRLAGDSDLASDITQEAFVRAFAKLHQFQGAAALRTWLIAVLVSSAGSVMRKGRWLSAKSTQLTDVIPADASPSSAHDLTHDITVALGDLSDKLRPVVVMHDIEGLTHREIAAALCIPEGTSKARLFDARARLRVALHHHWEDRRL